MNAEKMSRIPELMTSVKDKWSQETGKLQTGNVCSSWTDSQKTLLQEASADKNHSTTHTCFTKGIGFDQSQLVEKV